jgi:hypothetical protein
MSTIYMNGAMYMTSSAALFNINFRDGKLFLSAKDNMRPTSFVLMIDIAASTITEYTAISFEQVDGSAFDSHGKFFLTNSPSCHIRQVNFTLVPTGAYNPIPPEALTPLSGSSDCASIDGIGASVRLNKPSNLIVDSTNGILYFFEPLSGRIRVLQGSAPCSAGSYCPAGSSSLNQGGVCPAGFFCPQGSDRMPCWAGKYCNAGTQAAALAPSCSAGFYCPAGSSTLDQGGLCPVGYFCGAGADRTNCTAGMYCPAGSSTMDQGGLCAAGYYCPSGQERVACVGSYCEAGESVANRVKCMAGYACPGNGVLRTQCVAGWYANVGSSACTQCPRGLVAAIPGACR